MWALQVGTICGANVGLEWVEDEQAWIFDLLIIRVVLIKMDEDIEVD